MVRRVLYDSRSICNPILHGDMMRIQFFLAAAALLLSSSVAARADYVYTVTVNDFGNTFYDGTVTFDEPSILTSNTTIPTTDLTLTPGSADITSLVINPSGDTCSGLTTHTATGEASCLSIYYATPPETYGYYTGFSTTIDSVGNHDALADIVTFSIEPETSVAPEPSTIALLGTGFLGFAGMLRRRYVA
jgi:PEP-CTERM motif